MYTRLSLYSCINTFRYIRNNSGNINNDLDLKLFHFEVFEIFNSHPLSSQSVQLRDLIFSLIHIKYHYLFFISNYGGNVKQSNIMSRMEANYVLYLHLSYTWHQYDKFCICVN